MDKQGVQRLVSCSNCILNWFGEHEQIYICMLIFLVLLTSICQYKKIILRIGVLLRVEDTEFAKQLVYCILFRTVVYCSFLIFL